MKNKTKKSLEDIVTKELIDKGRIYTTEAKDAQKEIIRRITQTQLNIAMEE